jgi:hypothetical protein
MQRHITSVQQNVVSAASEQEQSSGCEVEVAGIDDGSRPLRQVGWIVYLQIRFFAPHIPL